MALNNVAIIGSFRQQYKAVLSAFNSFTEAGLVVTSPLGTTILENGVSFVRFESDPTNWVNHHIQTVALHRILRADFVFVVAPNGYIGKTTCYEVGRIVQAKRPIYFSSYPDDLPIYVPDEHIKTKEEIIAGIYQSTFVAQALYVDPNIETTKYEHDLLLGIYREDETFYQ